MYVIFWRMNLNLAILPEALEWICAESQLFFCFPESIYLYVKLQNLFLISRLWFFQPLQAAWNKADWISLVTVENHVRQLEIKSILDFMLKRKQQLHTHIFFQWHDCDLLGNILEKNIMQLIVSAIWNIQISHC